MKYKYELALKMLRETMDDYAAAWDLEEADEVYAMFEEWERELVEAIANE